VYRFSPVVSRALLEKSGSHLLGCVCALDGDEARVEAAVAACYPSIRSPPRGPLPPGGLVFDGAADCFRREPSRVIDRLQSFRMREFVAIGPPKQIADFREHWIARAPEIAGALGLSPRIEAASDPFFGRADAMVERFQVTQALKFEILLPIRSAESPTACMSFNYHRDYSE
jgi:hypothetical protein